MRLRLGTAGTFWMAVALTVKNGVGTDVALGGLLARV